jgi:hypothetical protein
MEAYCLHFYIFQVKSSALLNTERMYKIFFISILAMFECDYRRGLDT